MPDLNDIKDGIVNSLLQDTRIQKIDNLGLRRDGGSLYITFNIIVKQVDIPIPVQIKIA